VQSQPSFFFVSTFRAIFFLVFGCLRDQDVVGSQKKVAEKIPGTKITWYYFLRLLRRSFKCRRHLYPKPPETFERKLRLFWLKEQLIKI